MQAIFRQNQESMRIHATTPRQRIAMDCITNTHENIQFYQPRQGMDGKRKRRFTSTGTRNSYIKERHSLQGWASPRLEPSRHSTLSDGGMTFADSVRASMSRRGYHDLPTDYATRVGIQARRRGFSDSKQYAPLQINVPPVSTLCELEGRFENPRKAPLPQGIKFSATQNGIASPMPISSSTTNTPARTPEVKNIAQASIFSLPKFDPEREMRKLQSLWTRRGALILSPLFRRSTSPRQQMLGPSMLNLSGGRREVSFFEEDSETEDEDASSRKKSWKVRRRSGRSSFSALRRALVGNERTLLKDFPSIDVVPSEPWKRTFSVCNEEGQRILMLEISADSTTLVGGTLKGIALELFRTQDEDMKQFIIRSHTTFTTTAQILDTIHGCLVNNEVSHYWDSSEAAALRLLNTLALWFEMRPDELNQGIRKQQISDILNWCTENAHEDDRDLCRATVQKFEVATYQMELGNSWLIASDERLRSKDLDTPVLELTAWELTQYLAIYDYLYLLDLLSHRSVEELLAPIAADEVTVLSNPDLRAEQIRYWVTIEILNSPSIATRVRWICLFIETATVANVENKLIQALLELSDYFSAFTIVNTLNSAEVQSLVQTWKKIPPELVHSLQHISDISRTGESWSSHVEHFQKQRRSCLPYLPCILQELQQINTNQPTYVNLHEGSLCVSDEPFIVPAQPGTGMINLRKFRCMYDLVGDALEAIQAPTSFWYRLFPEDPQFPKTPRIDKNVLERWEGTRRLVENAIMGCWIGNIGDGNWERSLHVKKVLASAGF